MSKIETQDDSQVFAKPASEAFSTPLRGWKSRPIAPARSSALESVPAPSRPKYQRREFYLKIEGLAGPRYPVSRPRNP